MSTATLPPSEPRPTAFPAEVPPRGGASPPAGAPEGDLHQDPPPPVPPRRSPTRAILIGLGVLALLAVLALALGNRGGDTAVTVEMAEAQVRAITQTVTGSGKIRPEVEVPLASEVSGEVVYLAVREGDRVQEGQLLVRVRGDMYAAQREQAQAGLLQAQADAARARAERIQTEADLERQRGLHARGVVPQAELEAASTRAEVARAAEEAATFRVRSAQASVTQAADQLRRTAIYAPMSGTVSMLNVEPGQRVVGTAQMTGTELMRIAELDQMELEVDINENDVVNVTLGDSARVEVDAYPDRPLRGVITQIANSARVAGAGTQEQTTNFPVKIQITSAHNQFAEAVAPLAPAAEGSPAGVPLLRPGMSGTVDIFTETLDRAVVVPIQAVTVRDFNEVRRAAGEEVDAYAREDLRRVVFVVRDDRAHLVEVTTGISDATHIAVLSGLAGGETVVTGPFRVLRTELQDDTPVQRREPVTRGASRPAR